MSVNQNNKHVEDYLDYYIAASHPSRYAILLKGKWGSGKTWFIKKYYENLNQTREKSVLRQPVPIVWGKFCNWILRKPQQTYKGNRCLYISLNGLDSVADIDESIYQQLHPFWSSEQVKAVGTVIKSLLKGSLKIDLTNDDKDRGIWNIQIPDIPNNFEYSNRKDMDKRVLIFDDLERCSMDIKEILGYINSFVEFQGLKVLIIADEDKINEKHKEYKDIKEKTIGKTLEIFPDFIGALNDFIKQETEGFKKIFQNNANYIFNLFEKAECKNLRILNYIILDFKKVFEKLPQIVKDNSEAMQEILQLMVVFSIEISNGKLNSQDIGNIHKKIEVEYLAESHNTLFTQMFSKYGIYISRTNRWFPSLSWWECFFDKGIVNEDILTEIISTSEYFQDKDTPNWLKLYHYSNHSDIEFKDILKQVEAEYANRKFEDIGIIKHITGLFLEFSNDKLYTKEESDIIDEAKRYIDELKKSGKLDTKPSEGNHYKGIYFIANNCKSFQDFDEHIKQCQDETKLQNMPNKANKLMDIMLQEVTHFGAMININSSRDDIIDETYYELPIFSYLPAEKFLEKILILSNEDKEYVFFSLQERYKSTFVKKLVSELDFLQEFQKILVKVITQRQGELSGKILGYLNKKYLMGTISKFEQIKNNSQSNNT